MPDSCYRHLLREDILNLYHGSSDFESIAIFIQTLKCSEKILYKNALQRIYQSIVIKQKPIVCLIQLKSINLNFFDQTMHYIFLTRSIVVWSARMNSLYIKKKPNQDWFGFHLFYLCLGSCTSFSCPLLNLPFQSRTILWLKQFKP